MLEETGGAGRKLPSQRQRFLHCLVNIQKQAIHVFLRVPLLSITAYFVNVLLGNIKNVTPGS
jgi:hypothetical protein